MAAVPEGEPAYADVHDLEDLPGHLREESKHFFSTYPQLDDGGGATNEGQQGREVALRVLQECRERWRAEQD